MKEVQLLGVHPYIISLLEAGNRCFLGGVVTDYRELHSLLDSLVCVRNSIVNALIIDRADMIGKPSSGFGKDIEHQIYPNVLKFLNFIVIPGGCRQSTTM